MTADARSQSGRLRFARLMDSTRKPRTLLISPHVEAPITRLQELMGGEESLELFISNPVKVQGDKRGVLNRLKYYWVDPLLTMLRVVPRLHRYERVICFYHRTGYWVGIYRRLFSGSNPALAVWIGFAPNPKLKGAKGRLKEALTYSALQGHSLIICNSRSVVESIRRRFPLVEDRLAFVRWGGDHRPMCQDNADIQGMNLGGKDSYVFMGGRTNRDFEMVLTAVRELGCPAVFVVPNDYQFKGPVPGTVRILRDVSSERFQRLISDAGVVVIALDKPDVSSGQVVLNRAMQCAKPIIVTQLAGIDDYVTDGKDALFVRPHDPADLAAKIHLLLTNRELREKLSAASFEKYVTGFNSDTFARDLFVVLSGLDRKT